MQKDKLRARTAILLDLIPLDPVSYLKVDTGLNYGIGSNATNYLQWSASKSIHQITKSIQF